MANDMDDSPLPVHAEHDKKHNSDATRPVHGNAHASYSECAAVPFENAPVPTQQNKQSVPCLSKKEQEDLLKEDEKLYEEQRGQQIKSLEEVKESLAEDPSLSSKSKSERRMTFLMAQSEVFTQFLMGGSTAIGKEMFSRSKSGGSSRRAGDDDCKRDSRKAHEMIDLDSGHTRVTRIMHQPKSIEFDDDIDAILAKGEERTEAMKSKVAADMQHSLANFSLLATESSNGSVSGLYEFEGANFAKDVNTSNGSILPSTFIALPQRERKTIYTDSELYGETAGGATKVKKPKKSTDTHLKIPAMHDYQFFQQEKLSSLYAQKHQIELQRKELMKQIKEAKAEEVKETPEDRIDVTDERPPGDSEILPSVRLEQELQLIGLSAEQSEAIEQLEEEGFGEWTRRDFKVFISACERYGRDLREQICRDVANQTGKLVGYVERYYDTFWVRYAELKDHQKYIDKIERGEKRLARIQIVKESLARKCSRYSDPLRDMKLTYPSGYVSKGFTMEEDVFLVVMMNKYAPLEHWSEIRDEIRVAWQFRFNWFIKSRAIGELQKRGEFLTRLIEKENEELRLKHERDEHTLKKKAAPASSSSKTKSRNSSGSKKSKHPSDHSSSQRKKRRAR
ncbi:hypothetical protein ABG067_002678 [Albugo candida]